MDPGQYTGAFDGSCKPNPGEMKIGGWIATPNRCKIHEFSESIGPGTNNVAEYHALVKILTYAIELGIKRISLRSDSILVVNQVNQKWKAEDPRIVELRNKCLDLIKQMDEVIIKHVNRKFNTRADQLTKQGESNKCKILSY